MANIVDIVFNNVSVTQAGHTASITGTIEVNYDTPTPTVTNGALQVAIDGTNAANFTVFTMTQPVTGVFNIASTSGLNVIDVGYVGQQPGSVGGLFLALPGAGLTFSAPVPSPFVTNSVTSTLVCYAAGTLIRTPRGDVAIETLEAGDLVVTGSGDLRPIKWVGHRVVDCRNHSNPRAVLPVRIAADAFGPSRPAQDLFVSPAHSVCVDLCGEVLIHAANLINGATIAQVEVEEIDYWHVELDSHDILIANNLPAESYLEMANRGFFVEGGATLADYGAGGLRTHADFCRPVVTDGPLLQFVRQRLSARAGAIGWTPSRDAELRLLVDGEVCRPVTDGETSIFRFPSEARDVRLVSNTFVPGDVGGGDPRVLGVALHGLAVSAGHGQEFSAVSLGDPRLRAGLHPEEARDGAHWRWTKGDLALSPEFWAGIAGQVTLRVSHDSNAPRRWLAPEPKQVVGRPQTLAFARRRAEPKLRIAGGR